jgi:hypothetical protein
VNNWDGRNCFVISKPHSWRANRLAALAFAWLMEVDSFSAKEIEKMKEILELLTMKHFVLIS